MGWDAFSTLYSRDPVPRFVEASERVKQKCSVVDGLLPYGGLDFRICGTALTQATGQSVYDENDWPADLVEELNAKANWNFTHDSHGAEYPKWAIESAKEFLAACAELYCGIRFSW